MIRLSPTLTALALSACGGRDFEGAVYAPTSTGDAALDVDLIVTVIPTDERTVDGEILALPEVFGPYTQSWLTSRDVDLVLDAPVRVSGTVTGPAVTPAAALGGLPSVDGPAAGRVHLVREDGLAAFDVAADENGVFEVDVNPASYELSAIPDSTSLAPGWVSVSIDAGASRHDLALEQGQAIYGQITEGGQAFAGCRVHAVDDAGHSTADAVVSEDGFYEIRVPPGRWSLVTTGLSDGKDPILTQPPVDVTADEGAEVDVEYPAPKTHPTASFRVLSNTGNSLDSVPVRFTALDLDGYSTGEPQLVLEDRSFDGTVDLRVSPGVWRIEVMPDGEAFSGYATPTGLTIRDDEQLPDVVLDPLVEVRGIVVDDSGAPLVDARLTCKEVGFAGRSWTTLSGPDGTWMEALPAPGASCTVLPPGTRLDLAPLTQDVFPTTGATVDFPLPSGQIASGKVTFQEQPAQFAIVQVSTPEGMLVSSGLTDRDGAFQVALPPPE
jgi:hypothetical protein